ncbi:related to LTV1 - low-temperature viability protein [Melanopsichium pennsylvanicum]|uniref:Related to LTV1 - low-temperature viability protein n=2 Tax=Melanopsichium pennsylvanicum TaxID=63383 RepID=A0AAJ5C524_9BASI|nr:related to LTV1-low-temperature viability protein [Melanopsichium pennsylvanicum 4]SNX84089.1 related to LTV1 - low-temperature viability protein [Melanopsichium pennsylvanicum]
MPTKSKTKNKSIWRSDKAQHFQLVHRSQRDPLINDPDAGAHVLLSYDPANQSRAKGKTRAELEADASLTRDKLGKPIRSNIGEAANYGVYFDDTEYDYMQHLRPINDDENVKRGGENVDETLDTILVSAAGANKAKAKAKDSFALKQDAQADNSKAEHALNLPASVLPSKNEIPFSFTSHLAVEPSLQGFQPDMDPHLRQALEALDDEAFVDDDLDDDFFGEVVADGEWDGVVRPDDEWRNDAPEGDEAIWADPALRAQRELAELGQENLSLEARIALFKQQQQLERNQKASGLHHGQDQEQDQDEDRDELASLREGSRAGSRAGTMYTAGGTAIGKKGKPGALARRAASTKAPSIGGGSTAWSMSSSAMFRNKGLTDLDDRFAQLGRKYGIKQDFDPSLESLEDLEEEEDDEEFVDSDGEEAGEVVTREDFEGIMDDFLAKYETKHGKLREALGGIDSTSVEKLTILRQALGKARINGREWAGKQDDEGKGEGDLGEYEDYESPDEEIVDPVPRSHMREKWDVETIQSTKTNLENHPRTLSAKESVFGGSNASAFRPGSLAGGTGGGAAGGGMAKLGSGLAPSMTSYTSQRPSASAFLNDQERLPKIRINPRTGFPEIVGYSKPRSHGNKKKNGAPFNSLDDEAGSDKGDEHGRGALRLPKANGCAGLGSDTEESEGEEEDDDDDDDDDDYDSDATEGGELARRMSTIAVTSKRDRNESKEDRKARKQALKVNKKERKERKLKTKIAFASEKKRQQKAEKGRKQSEGGPAGMRLL